ncbi:hypothetical protein GALMADRAFT_387012 [Galerina marginata CBS 339.88]|uniref:Nephrocystin 3-like N-terminal domain-containing protein n=1 Tax=Galerina marginata (strain CBS 339.88) TaxID=685588 RepID=A0A067TTX7_GALM3|nr:hypothetical protein GALMADRAFT_387012 [Galerina marginata CBS 339.88]
MSPWHSREDNKRYHGVDLPSRPTIEHFMELLREEPPGRYAGSFFFARGIAGRNSGEALFSTLAYQIAKNIPGMQAHIDDAMNADQTLPTKSLDIQLQSLIIGPLSRFGDLTHIPTVIIDGLDECLGSRNQRAILSLIAKARTISHVPLRFVIASRPEFCICDSFDKKPLFDITKQISLTDTTDNWDANKDIDTYLRDGFAKIYEENSDIMDDVQLPWPSEETISNFVQKSSGQFVYASTVLRFVGEASDFDSPETQLQIITSPGPLRSRAFSDLDQLYTTILSAYPRPDTLLRVLGGLLVNASLEALEMITGLSVLEIKIVLRAVASLVYLSNGHTWVTEENMDDDKDLENVYGHKSYFTFCHLSFREFLEDKNRSGPFSIDVQALHDDIFGRLFDTVYDGLKGICRYSELICSQAWSDMYQGSPPELRLQASPEKIRNCVERLQSDLHQFSLGDRFIPSQAKCLLRYMSMVEKLLLSVLSDDTPLVIAILPKIRAIQDLSIKYLLSISSSSLLETLSYFMATWDDDDRFAGLFFSRICYLKDFSVVDEAWAKAFLIQNAHFFERSELDWEYRPLGCLSSFLRNPSRGGTFHAQFRAHCIRTCERFLLQLPLTDIGISILKSPRILVCRGILRRPRYFKHQDRQRHFCHGGPYQYIVPL